MAGTSRSGEVRLTFENLPVLLKNLTPARLKLLEAVKRSGPMSINELARLLGRNYKNVHTDVTRPRRTGVDRKGCRSTYRGGMGHDHGRDEAGRMSGRSVA